LVDSGKMSLKQKFAREALGQDWKALVVCVPSTSSSVIGGDSNDQEMQMRSVDCIGQVRTVKTSQFYFTKVPDSLPKLTKDDYHPSADEQSVWR
jgi:hypothetical protein